MKDSPYKFLDYYKLLDEQYFFGRKAETRILMADVINNRLVLLFARTGTGKTSLINAGVCPRLENRGYKTFYIRVSKDPEESARQTLLDYFGLGGLQTESLLEIFNKAKQKDEAAQQAAKTSGQQAPPTKLKTPLVLFFDQFEEFFIYLFEENNKKALAFISDVGKIYRDESLKVHLVFSMREDFLARMDVFRDEIPCIFDSNSNLRLRWFNESQARDAIVEPALTEGVQIEDALADRLIKDLSIHGEVEPAKLQIVCDTLWRKKAKGRKTLTLADYRELAGEGDNIAGQILFQRLEEQFETIKGEEELEMLERMLPHLRNQETKTKRVRDIEDLAKELGTDADTLCALLAQLEETRLLRLTHLGSLRVVELSHDYLVGHLEGLQARVEAIWPRRALGDALKDYEASGRKSEHLMTAENLGKITAKANALALNRKQVEFLFRSSLVCGVQQAFWLDYAIKSKVGVWKILREKIESRDEAAYVIDMLARLPDAALPKSQMVELLETALQRSDLAAYAIECFSHVETICAVEFLEMALAQEEFISPAREALLWLAKSKKNPQVALRAKEVLNKFAGAHTSEAETKEHFKSGAKETTGKTTSVFRSNFIIQKSETSFWMGSTDTDAESASAVKPTELHYRRMIDALIRGRMTMILGDGVNLCGRPPKTSWQQGYAPTNSELAAYLAEKVGYQSEGGYSLAHISEYAALMYDRVWVNQTLSEVLATDFKPNHAHKFLASLPGQRRRIGKGSERPLIITASYDNLLETAFRQGNEEFDLITYVGEGAERGKFLHTMPDGRSSIVNRLTFSSSDDSGRAVIVKLYGALKGTKPDRDRLIITEDDFINYLSGEDVANLLSLDLTAYIHRTGCLFLGYSMRDWSSRVFLSRVWDVPTRSYRSWAIQSQAQRIDEIFWRSRDIDLINMPLEDFISELDARLKTVPKMSST